MAPKAHKPVSKAAWLRRNDRGPHLAWLPSGPDPENDAPVKFVIADSGMLLRSGKLPSHVRITATLAAAHEGGASGYMQDLVQTAIFTPDARQTITNAIDAGVELSHHLIAEMLVEPAVTPEEVAEGALPELDVRMLLEFADRRRNIDAAGNRLPIIVIDEDKWATFRVGSDDAGGAADAGANGADVRGDLPDADGDDV